MSSLSKSPKAVAKIAYEVAKRSLPEYRHQKSPKKFTQHQLAAILILREFFKTDYRGIEAIIKDSIDLQRVLELVEIPHYTTIQKAAHRIKKSDLDRLLAGFLIPARKMRVLKKNILLSAIDGTGFESRHISSYFVKRKAKGQDIFRMMTYTRYPKAGIITDCSNHLVLSIVTGRGPAPDITHFERAIGEAEKNVHLKILAADAGYDSERHTDLPEKSTAFARSSPDVSADRPRSFPQGNIEGSWPLDSTANCMANAGRWRRSIQ
jgi:hypothetical protein